MSRKPLYDQLVDAGIRAYATMVTRGHGLIASLRNWRRVRREIRWRWTGSHLYFDILECATPTEVFMVVDRQPCRGGLGVALNAENVIEYE